MLSNAPCASDINSIELSGASEINSDDEVSSTSSASEMNSDVLSSASSGIKVKTPSTPVFRLTACPSTVRTQSPEMTMLKLELKRSVPLVLERAPAAVRTVNIGSAYEKWISECKRRGMTSEQFATYLLTMLPPVLNNTAVTVATAITTGSSNPSSTVTSGPGTSISLGEAGRMMTSAESSDMRTRMAVNDPSTVLRVKPQRYTYSHQPFTCGEFVSKAPGIKQAMERTITKTSNQTTIRQNSSQKRPVESSTEDFFSPLNVVIKQKRGRPKIIKRFGLPAAATVTPTSIRPQLIESHSRISNQENIKEKDSMGQCVQPTCITIARNISPQVISQQMQFPGMNGINSSNTGPVATYITFPAPQPSFPQNVLYYSNSPMNSQVSSANFNVQGSPVCDMNNSLNDPEDILSDMCRTLSGSCELIAPNSDSQVRIKEEPNDDDEEEHRAEESELIIPDSIQPELQTNMAFKTELL